jgi:hypothetical protein
MNTLIDDGIIAIEVSHIRYTKDDTIVNLDPPRQFVIFRERNPSCIDFDVCVFDVSRKHYISAEFVDFLRIIEYCIIVQPWNVQ